MASANCHILSGEYAPALGGVADYTRTVARALAAAGQRVHVWAPATPGSLREDPGICLHPLVDGFGVRGLVALASAMQEQRLPRRLLVQYVPQAFGMRGLNVPLCRWIAGLQDIEVWIMFHEVAVPKGSLWRWRSRVLRLMQREMATLLLGRADRVFVSIPAWVDMLRSIAPSWRGAATWLPIPSNVSTHVGAGRRAEVRSRLLVGPEERVVGHFGTYGPHIAPLLTACLADLLRPHRQVRVLLIGRGGDEYARELERELTRSGCARGRVNATGVLDDQEVAAHLTACDLLIQPYPDGVSSRRTSVMAGLALGVPVVTNEGPLTEPVWRESQGVAFAPSARELATTAEGLLLHDERRRSLGQRGRDLYERSFSIERTIGELCTPADAGAA